MPVADEEDIHTWTTAYENLSDGATRTTLTDPLTYQTQREFDALGRLKTIACLNENPKLTPDVTMTYNKVGSRLSMSESDGITTVRETEFDYDGLRRLVSATFDDGTGEQTVSYVYDAGGRRTQMTLPDDLSITYEYDARGQLIAMTDWDGQTTRFAYDRAGWHAATLRANGLRTRYQHDAGGRLRLLRHSGHGKTLAQFAYTTDKRGNRTQALEWLRRPGAAQTEIDPVGELMSLNGYAYANGNPVNLTDANGLCAQPTQWWNPADANCYYSAVGLAQRFSNGDPSACQAWFDKVYPIVKTAK